MRALPKKQAQAAFHHVKAKTLYASQVKTRLKNLLTFRHEKGVFAATIPSSGGWPKQKTPFIDAGRETIFGESA